LRRIRAGTLLVLSAPLWAAPAGAQGLSVDVGAGRFVYDAVSASVPSDNLIGVVRYEGRREAWVFGAAGAPLGAGDTFWLAAGTGGRFLAGPARRLSFGADVAAHGFSFRDAVADQLGTGGTIEALPLVRLAAGAGSFEARAGWRGHTLSFGGLRESRGVVDAGVRAGYGLTVRAEAEGRWVRAREGTYPFAGVSLAYRPARFGLWATGGRWLSDDLDEVSWGVGADANLGPRLTLWAGIRQDAPDPLYWNPSRRTWSVGLTTRLRRVRPALAPVARSSAGRVLVRIRSTDAPPGPVWIAGDFNAWNPQPMRREGETWVIDLPLEPGVYNYAFRTGGGEWFVPASTPGRRDDGMGGHVAVLVVS
jgi:hypothetical protein